MEVRDDTIDYTGLTLTRDSPHTHTHQGPHLSSFKHTLGTGLFKATYIVPVDSTAENEGPSQGTICIY